MGAIERNGLYAFQNLFMENTDKKILRNTIERKVGALMMQHQHSLEERRERSGRLRGVLRAFKGCCASQIATSDCLGGGDVFY